MYIEKRHNLNICIFCYLKFQVTAKYAVMFITVQYNVTYTTGKNIPVIVFLHIFYYVLVTSFKVIVYVLMYVTLVI